MELPGGPVKVGSLCSRRRFELTAGGGFGISNKVGFASDFRRLRR